MDLSKLSREDLERMVLNKEPIGVTHTYKDIERKNLLTDWLIEFFKWAKVNGAWADARFINITRIQELIERFEQHKQGG